MVITECHLSRTDVLGEQRKKPDLAPESRRGTALGRIYVSIVHVADPPPVLQPANGSVYMPPLFWSR